jgi:hypothetical protein
MARPKKTSTTTVSEETELVVIERLERRTAVLYLLGTTPLIMNRLPKKAREQLLMPAPTLNRAARSQKLKHDVPAEYRDSVYLCRDADAPTRVHMPAGAFKKAMASAAIDIPGAKKAEIGRLLKVTSPTIHIYGVPKLFMAVVRNAGFTRVPDIRTRAIFPQWCCKIEIRYIHGRIRQQDIVNLADAAGEIIGVGDGRTERGTFDYGSFELVNSENDRRFQEVMKTGGRKAQDAALANPVSFDADTDEMLSYFSSELIRRERKGHGPSDDDDAVTVVKSPKRKRKNGGDEAEVSV